MEDYSVPETSTDFRRWINEYTRQLISRNSTKGAVYYLNRVVNSISRGVLAWAVSFPGASTGIVEEQNIIRGMRVFGELPNFDRDIETETKDSLLNLLYRTYQSSGFLRNDVAISQGALDLLSRIIQHFLSRIVRGADQIRESRKKKTLCFSDISDFLDSDDEILKMFQKINHICPHSVPNFEGDI
jgi:histone H3/H4